MWSPCGCNTHRNRTICTSAPNLQSIQTTHLMFSLQNIETSQTARKTVRKIKDKKNRFQISTPFYYHDIPKRCPFEEIRERSKKESKEEDWNPKVKRWDAYHDVRFSSNPNSKAQLPLDGSLLAKLVGQHRCKKKNLRFPVPSDAQTRSSSRSCTRKRERSHNSPATFRV